MSVTDLLLVAMGLAMDAFAVSMGKGLAMQRVRWRVALALGLFFGGFQALMPLVGWALGRRLLWLIEPVDHWMAFGLLALIGSKMIWDALHEGGTPSERDASGTITLGEYLVLAVATSVDALSVGISFAALGVDVAFAAAVIGVVTFALSVVGVIVGNAFGSRFERGAGVTGGVILIFIGVRILLGHLGVIAL